MKKLTRIKTWFVRFIKPDRNTLLEMGKDIRAVSLTVIGSTLLGLAINPTTTVIPLGITLVLGVVFWIYGMILTRIANMMDK